MSKYNFYLTLSLFVVIGQPSVLRLCCCLQQMYEHEHQTTMVTKAVAAMLSTILYYRRFFPYYAYNIIGGIDEEGDGQFFVNA